MLGVMLARLAGMVGGVLRMTVRRMGVVSGFLVAPGFVMLSRHFVMFGRLLVMIRRFAVMLCCLFRHFSYLLTSELLAGVPLI